MCKRQKNKKLQRNAQCAYKNNGKNSGRHKNTHHPRQNGRYRKKGGGR